MFIKNNCKTPDILKGITIIKSEDSSILIAKKEIILPENRVITLADMTEAERELLIVMGLL